MEKDLEETTEEELRELIQSAEKALEKLLTKRRRENLAEAKRLAALVGYEVDFRPADAEAHGEKQRGRLLPKYRNPHNPNQTWSGRGRRPKWLQQLEADGVSLDELHTQEAEPSEEAVEDASR